MQTNFTPAQLEDPHNEASEGIIRKCVHCGFCTATCPTYVLLGDELDSPRGRIYLIKDMLENQRKPAAETVRHIDRCLSCLSCVTTCPSGVNYMHLVDHARAYIEQNYRRPLHDRLLRRVLAGILPHRSRFRVAIRLAGIARPLTPVFRRFSATRALATMLDLAPARLPDAQDEPATSPKPTRGRVALLGGCVEPVLRPEFQAAAKRVLARAGYEIVPAPGAACCGALVQHMGRESDALDAARRNVDAWMGLIDDGGLSAILVTASGCGTTVKDYGHMLRNDRDYSYKAARVSALAMDISEFLAEAPITFSARQKLTVAYHSACSLQHGQQVREAPTRLLARAGFEVRQPAESHLCCGSAGVYNILQSGIAGQLGDRKVANLSRLNADVIATGNIGCATQIAARTGTPVVHTIELVDWASGGPLPAAMAPGSAEHSRPDSKTTS